MSLPYDPSLYTDPWQDVHPPGWNPFKESTDIGESRRGTHPETPVPRDPTQLHPWEEDWWDPNRGQGEGMLHTGEGGRGRESGPTQDELVGRHGQEGAYYDFWQTMVNWSKGLDVEDYMQQISPELQQLAEKGYGDQWLRQSYAQGMDEASRAKAQQLNQLGMQETMSGLTSGFNQRARDLTQFGFDIQGVLQEAALTNQNEAVKQGAQFKIGEIGQENEALAGQIGLFNQMNEFEKQRLKDELMYSSEEKFRQDALKDQQSATGWWSTWVKFATLLGMSLGE